MSTPNPTAISFFSRPLVAAAVALALGAVAMRSVLSTYMILAVIAYSLLLAGVASRRWPRHHAALMGSGVALDLTIVLLLQLQRDAVGTAVAMKLSPLQQMHVLFSLLAVLLYLPAIVAGYLRYQGRIPARRWHRALGVAAFGCRTLGLLLMFSLLGRAQG